MPGRHTTPAKNPLVRSLLTFIHSQKALSVLGLNNHTNPINPSNLIRPVAL